jgi:mannose-6-phosphate isomerase
MGRNDTPAPTLYPLVFKPVLKDYIWGGRNLERLGRVLPPGKIAESWEIAAHKDGDTVVINGEFAGLRLSELHERLGLDLIGEHNAWAQARDKFPLLIKLLDAHEKLSVQVHPDDQYALAHEGNELGKTEMWVILHAEPDAAVVYGMRKGTTPERFGECIADGTVESLLHVVPIHTGDFVCVPSGTVHAILGGSLIAEVQQNSNTTYRVFDWNRRQSDGTERELHIRQALDVINFDLIEPSFNRPFPISGEHATIPGIKRWLLCKNRYFTTERVVLSPHSTYNGCCNGQTLEIWGVIEGEIQVNNTRLSAVQFVLLPAGLGPFELKPRGTATCLRVYVED